MSAARLLKGTLVTVLAELERLDPASLIAARARGVLEAFNATTGGSLGRPKATKTARDEQIAELYKSGLTAAEVSGRVGVDRMTVYRSLRRSGVESRRPGYTSRPAKAATARIERLERMKALRARGATLEEIGLAEGIRCERVRQVLSAAGVDTQTRELKDAERAIAADYANGMSLEQAAAKGGVSVCRVKTILARAGVAVRPAPKLSKRQPETIAAAERAARLYNSGRVARDIASELGLKRPEQIYRLLAIAGVEPSRARRGHRHVVTNAAVAA